MIFGRGQRIKEGRSIKIFDVFFKIAIRPRSRAARLQGTAKDTSIGLSLFDICLNCCLTSAGNSSRFGKIVFRQFLGNIGVVGRLLILCCIIKLIDIHLFLQIELLSLISGLRIIHGSLILVGRIKLIDRIIGFGNISLLTELLGSNLTA